LETASDDLTLTLETTTKKRGKGVIEWLHREINKS
jgi:hypothetical protein